MSDDKILQAAQDVYDKTEYPEVRKVLAKVIQLLQKGRETIEFRGEQFPGICSCGCGVRIDRQAVILLGTGLIFRDEDHLAHFVESRTADITIREVEPCTLN